MSLLHIILTTIQIYMNKTIIYFILLVPLLSGCLINLVYTKYTICDCCKTVYNDIKSAEKCISDNPNTKRTSDNRLFLLAYVNKDVKAYQDLGWDIITDEKVRKTAQRDCLLIILEKKHINHTEEWVQEEHNDVIDKHNEELFFVLANQSLVPLTSWNNDDDKRMIIDDIEVGNGP